MKPTRRNFIKGIGVGILGNWLIYDLPFGVLARAKDYDDGIEIGKGFKVFNLETQKSMEALAEAIIPGAKEMGIRSIFMDYISANPGLAGFFDSGLWNLDGVSKAKFKKPFYQLEKQEDKKALIEHISGHNKAFFNQFRETIVRLYYSNPAVWKRLSYNGPPQPRGFMDYYLPPQRVGEK